MQFKLSHPKRESGGWVGMIQQQNVNNSALFWLWQPFKTAQQAKEGTLADENQARPGCFFFALHYFWGAGLPAVASAASQGLQPSGNVLSSHPAALGHICPECRKGCGPNTGCVHLMIIFFEERALSNRFRDADPAGGLIKG